MIAEVSALEVRYGARPRGPARRAAAAPVPAPALTGVSVGVRAGEVLAVLGASGSGKTTLARVFAGAAEELGAAVAFERFSRPRRPALIEQEARESLHPLLRVGVQLRDCLAADSESAELLRAVGLDPAVHGLRYPHELSGGEAQRVAIARALALEADLLVADEITAALDAIATARILGILRRIVDANRVGCLLVTHDLGVCRAVADRLVVLAAGRIVEEGRPREVLAHPHGAHTRELVAGAREGSL